MNTENHFKKVPLSKIEPRDVQPRHYFDMEDIKALAKSIRHDGLLQPLIVREMTGEDKYQIIAGENRYRALKYLASDGKLDIKEIPVFVREVGDSSAQDLALIENMLRSDLLPLDKAEAIKAYMKRNGLNQVQMAEILGMTPANVQNIIVLDKLLDEIKKEVRVEPRYTLRDLMSLARKKTEEQPAEFKTLKEKLEARNKRRKKTDEDRQNDYNRRVRRCATDIQIAASLPDKCKLEKEDGEMLFKSALYCIDKLLAMPEYSNFQNVVSRQAISTYVKEIEEMIAKRQKEEEEKQKKAKAKTESTAVKTENTDTKSAETNNFSIEEVTSTDSAKAL